MINIGTASTKRVLIVLTTTSSIVSEFLNLTVISCLLLRIFRLLTTPLLEARAYSNTVLPFSVTKVRKYLKIL